MGFLDWFLMPIAPGASVFILLLSLGLSFLTSLANRLLTNPEQQSAWRKEINEWTSQFNKARRSGDKKLLEKLQKQQKRILQLQSKMFKQSMKVSLIFFIPFLLIWQLLIGLYGANPVVFLPGVGWLTVFFWYFLCSLFFSTVFSRMFNVGMGAPEE
ncbi:MAG: EMC3/TMCO1 family protein [Candidatus Bathyarchaeia archaeon]